jgi:hypothetical protein
MAKDTLRAKARKLMPIISYGLGSIIIAVWTLLRFFNQRTIFDHVSQQVIVHQWLHGTVTTAKMGSTAYVPKMLLLYVPTDYLPGSPRLKLIILTIIINVASYLLIAFSIRKILSEFKIDVSGQFYLGLLWFAAIAGSVFWISFVNSRNIEVAGGIFLWYCGLRFLRRPSRMSAIGLVLLTSVLFFADPLQLYMTALPLIIYVLIQSLTLRRIGTFGYLTLIIITGLVLSKLLFVASEHLLLLTFAGTTHTALPSLSLSWLLHSLVGVAKSTATLFVGAFDAGRLRVVVNIIFLIGLGTLAAFASLRKWIPKRLVLFIATIFITNELVYIASRQAAQPDTSRYLIMLAPTLLLGFSALKLPRRLRASAAIGASFVLLINVVALSGALMQHWNTSFPKDAHLASIYRYYLAHPNTGMYASADSAMPILYYHDLPAIKFLPIACSGSSLVKTQYSMGSAFLQAEKMPNRTIALILDGEAITNTPNRCTSDSIAQQLHPPLSTDQTDDGSTVLIYKQASLQISK